jgi:hypothetical protein
LDGKVLSTVDTARAGQGRLPRLLCRALLVLGGALGASVIGWLITSATASADTLPVPPVASVVDMVTQAGAPAKPAGLPATTAPLALPAAGMAGVTGALGGAVRQLGDHVRMDRTVAAPTLAAPASTTAVMSTSAGQSGPAGGRIHPRTLPGPAAVTTPPTPSGTVAPRHSVRPPADLRFPALPTIPTRPTAPVPWSPVSVPATPNGGAGMAGASGLGFVDANGAPPAPRLDLVRVVPVTTAPRQLTAGRQPGITPD